MKRKSIKSVIGKTIAKIEPNVDNPNYMDFVDTEGNVLFSVQVSDMFDEDGFHFDTWDC